MERPRTRSGDGLDVTRGRLRVGSRIAIALGAMAMLVLVAMQVEVVVAKNVAIVRDLRDTQDDIAALRRREREQEHALFRLRDARGAIPEIHDKLRLVGPHEELFSVRGLPDPTPAPEQWRPTP